MTAIPDDGWMDIADATGVSRPSRMTLISAPGWVSDLAGDSDPIDLLPVDPTTQAAIEPADRYECGACGGRGEVAVLADLDGNWETSTCRDCDGVGGFPEPVEVVHDFTLTGDLTAPFVRCTGSGCGWITGPFRHGAAAYAAGRAHIRSQS